MTTPCLPPVVDPAPLPLPQGLAAPWPARPGTWRPGLAAPCHHAEVFAPGGEGSGAGLALALALDGMRAAAPDPVADAPDERAWLWVQDRAALRLSGRPYLHGLPPLLRHRLVHVAASSPEDALFALEEGVRCRDLAFVLGEIAGNPRALDFTASRRLSLAAQKYGVPLWVVRLDAVRDLGSARLRWQACAAQSLPPRWNPHAPGHSAWDAELFRAHTYQPGRWMIRDDGRTLAAERAPQDYGPPHPGDLAGGAGDRSLAAR